MPKYIRKLAPDDKKVEETEMMLLDVMKENGYDGNIFTEQLKQYVTDRRKRGRSGKKIRYGLYCNWAYCLRKIRSSTDEIYSLPKQVLDFVRALEPNDITGEIRNDAQNISVEEFCQAIIPGASIVSS